MAFLVSATPPSGRHRGWVLVTAGINPKIVSERLGHSSVAVTMDIYSHVLPGMQEQAALAVEKLLERA